VPGDPPYFVKLSGAALSVSSSRSARRCCAYHWATPKVAWHITRPSTASYEALIRELYVGQYNLESGQHDPLAIGSYAQARVIEQLNSDAIVMDAAIANPLSVTLCALDDSRRSDRLPLPFDRPNSGGWPTDQSFDAVKAGARHGKRPPRLSKQPLAREFLVLARCVGFWDCDARKA
jgi:hypothetical protein